jgi:hypothetical protein
MNLKEKKKSIEELYKAIFSIRESLQESVSLAQEAVNISQQFGGEIPRVITDQLNTYFIPVVSKYIDDDETPGAMTPLVVFLDSVPLAMTREEPQIEQITPTTPENAVAGLTEPPTEPADESYAAQMKENWFSKRKLKKEDQANLKKREELGLPAAYSYEEIKEGVLKGMREHPAVDDLLNFVHIMYETMYLTTDEEDMLLEAIDEIGNSGQQLEFDFSETLKEKVRWRHEFNGQADSEDVKIISKLVGPVKIGWSDVGEAIADTIELVGEGAEADSIISHLRIRYQMSDRDARAILRGVNTYKDSLPVKPNATLIKKDGTRVPSVREAEEKDISIPPTKGSFVVKRKSKIGSTLGKQGQLEDEIVFSCNDKEEAQEYVDEYNSSVTPAEKEMFGTEFYLEEPKEFEQDKPEGEGKKVKEAVLELPKDNYGLDLTINWDQTNEKIYLEKNNVTVILSDFDFLHRIHKGEIIIPQQDWDKLKRGEVVTVPSAIDPEVWNTLQD